MQFFTQRVRGLRVLLLHIAEALLHHPSRRDRTTARARVVRMASSTLFLLTSLSLYVHVHVYMTPCARRWAHSAEIVQVLLSYQPKALTSPVERRMPLTRNFLPLAPVPARQSVASLSASLSNLSGALSLPLDRCFLFFSLFLLFRLPLSPFTPELRQKLLDYFEMAIPPTFSLFEEKTLESEIASPFNTLVSSLCHLLQALLHIPLSNYPEAEERLEAGGSIQTDSEKIKTGTYTSTDLSLSLPSILSLRPRTELSNAQSALFVSVFFSSSGTGREVRLDQSRGMSGSSASSLGLNVYREKLPCVRRCSVWSSVCEGLSA